MSRILANRCNIFRRACIQTRFLDDKHTVNYSTSASSQSEEPPIPYSIAQYRKEKEAASKQKPEVKLGKVKGTKGHQARQTISMKAPDEDIVAMLAKPTWSVRSLLPPDTPTQTITQKQLHHLLRLSALPLPKDQAEEEKMLESLHSQLHFVGDIQRVNTEGVEPLVRIAEETEAGVKENTIGLEDLRHVLDSEVVIGRNRRSRRVRAEGNVGEGEDWDVFKTASETIEVPGNGRYFVVRSGKGRSTDEVVP